MLLNRKSEGRAERANPLSRAMNALGAKTVDRRSFLKGTGITAGAAAFANQLPLNMIGEANAASAATGACAAASRAIPPRKSGGNRVRGPSGGRNGFAHSVLASQADGPSIRQPAAAHGTR